MNCPQCNAPNTRLRVSGTDFSNAQNLRRRRCLDCNYRWVTQETFLRPVYQHIPLGTKDIQDICDAIAAGATQISQAKRYGVSYQHISNLVRGKRSKFYR